MTEQIIEQAPQSANKIQAELTKRCPKCKNTKKYNEFSLRKNGYLFSWCRQCHNNHRRARLLDPGVKQKEKAQRDARRAANPVKADNARLKHRYGITSDQKASLIEQQNKECAICCGLITFSACVDHNHTSGIVRGILCKRCNTAIALFQENTYILRSAIFYLKIRDTIGCLDE